MKSSERKSLPDTFKVAAGGYHKLSTCGGFVGFGVSFLQAEKSRIVVGKAISLDKTSVVKTFNNRR